MMYNYVPVHNEETMMYIVTNDISFHARVGRFSPFFCI